MTEQQIIELLNAVWHHELSVNEAWRIIDYEREAPSEYSKEYWLPIKNDANKSEVPELIAVLDATERKT